VNFANRTGQGSFPVSNRVTLIEFEGLGGLCHAGRSAGLKQPEVRLRAQNIIESFLPDCIWLDDFKSLDKGVPLLSWFNDLDDCYLKTTRPAMLAAQISFTSFRWMKHVPLAVFNKRDSTTCARSISGTTISLWMHLATGINIRSRCATQIVWPLLRMALSFSRPYSKFSRVAFLIWMGEFLFRQSANDKVN